LATQQCCAAGFAKFASTDFLMVINLRGGVREFASVIFMTGTRGSVAGRSQVRDPMRELILFEFRTPSSRTRPWGSLSL
jgi:hypothetical protein